MVLQRVNLTLLGISEIFSHNLNPVNKKKWPKMTQKLKTIEELEILLPKDFYKQTALQLSQRSPYAIFSPVEATKGKGWVNSTTPMSKPQKKSLIMDIQSFENCNNDYEKMGVVTSLNTLGFDVYVKKKNESFVYFDAKTRTTLTQLEARLKDIGTFSQPDDYTTLVNTYQLAHDDCEYINKEVALHIQNKVLTEVNVKKLNANDQNIGCCLARLSPEDAVKELSSYGDDDYTFFKNKNIEINLTVLFYNLLDNEYIEMAREMLNIEPIHGGLVLLKVAQKGVLDIVQKCILNEVNVDTLNPNKRTALMEAIQNRHYDVVKLLLKNGAKVNVKDKDGWTALMEAAYNGHYEIVEQLVKNGAEINWSNNNGNTALMLAVNNSHYEIVEQLIKNGAEINCSNIKGNTALMFAANKGGPNITKLLLEKKAQVNVKGENDWTPLMVAASKGDLNITKLLLEKKAEVNLKRNDGFNALMVAANNSHYEIVEQLIKNGAEINWSNNNGNTALMFATEKGNLNITRLLLEKKAEINLQNKKKGWTALMIAAINVYPNITKLLLENDAEVNVKDEDEWTALMMAIGKGDLNITRILLENYAKVNLRCNDGRTTLMIAAQKGNASVVELLLNYGAQWKKVPEFKDITFKKDETHLTLARKIINKFNTIYLGEIITRSSLKTELENESFDMYPAGKVLNGSSCELQVRTKLCQFKDITKTLEYDNTPSISYTREDEIPNYELDEIEEYQKKNTEEEIYCNFSINILANEKVRLPSLDPNEELKGLRAMVDEKEIEVNLFRGDDDFFYVQVEQPCRIDYVVKADSPQKQNKFYQSIEGEAVKHHIDTFLNTQSNENTSLPKYDINHHQEWMQHIYQNKIGACKHFTGAVVHQITTMSPADKNNIRIVVINNNHVKLEMRHNGKWISCPDLGGLESGLIFHQKRYTIMSTPDSIERYRASSSKKKFHYLASFLPNRFTSNYEYQNFNPRRAKTESLPKKDVIDELHHKELLEEITTPNTLVDKALTSTDNHILVSLQKDSIQSCANSLIKNARENGRSVFYINSPNQIDIHQNSVFLHHDGTGKVSHQGHLEYFLEHSGQSYAGPIEHTQRPLLIINWSAFTPQQRVQYNTILDSKASVEGRELPEHFQIISLEKSITPQEYASKEAFITRHTKKLNFEGKFPKTQKALPKHAQVIDLYGKPDWKAALFGPVELQENKIVWKKSDFVKSLELEGTTKEFQIVNPPDGTHEEILQAIDQAKAYGAFTYHGYDINLSSDTDIHYLNKPFHFEQFNNRDTGTDYSITTGMTIDKAPQNSVIVNSHNFDKLLVSISIDNGVYDQVPGFIEKAGRSGEQKKDLQLYITGHLSKSQWYLLFQQAEKHNVTLHISTILSPTDIPTGLSSQAFAQKEVSKTTTTESNQRPNIIISNSIKAYLPTPDKDTITLHVEDYNSLDLWFGTVDVAEYDFKEGKYKNDFIYNESPVVKALESGKKVVLAGDFSGALLKYLEPVLAGKGVPNPHNLTFVIENPNLIKEQKQYTPLKWLPDSKYSVEFHETTKHLENNEPFWSEKQFDSSTTDLSDSQQKATVFIKKRIENVNRCFEKHHAIKIEGQAGVGKSSLFKNHRNQLNGTVFHGLDQLKEWAAPPKESGMHHVLVIDEANIDNTHYTMFEPLKKGMGHIIHEGELIHIKPHCKVAFLMNPKKDNLGNVYGGGRAKQKLFQDGEVPTLKLGPLPHVYTYQYILKEPIYDTLTPTLREKFPEEKFKQIALDVIKNNMSSEFTPRETQENVLQRLVGEVFKDQFVSQPTSITAHEFVSTPETNDSQLILEQTLSVRQLEHQGHISKNACGKPGVLIEGSPGLGKSEMIKAVLHNKGIHVVTAEKSDLNSSKQYCYKVDASLPLDRKKEIIQEAFDNGKMVWIDEINSCINDGLEKVLNAAMAGQNPKTGLPPEKGGFMVLATANSAAMEGRSVLGKALISRFNQTKMTPFEQYSDCSKKKIIKNMLKNKNTRGQDIDVVAENTCKKLKENKQICNLRDIATHINEHYKKTTSVFEKFKTASNVKSRKQKQTQQRKIVLGSKILKSTRL